MIKASDPLVTPMLAVTLRLYFLKCRGDQEVENETKGRVFHPRPHSPLMSAPG